MSRSRRTLSSVWSSRPYIRSMLIHSNPVRCALRTKSTHIRAECSRPHSCSTLSSKDCTPLDSLVHAERGEQLQLLRGERARVALEPDRGVRAEPEVLPVEVEQPADRVRRQQRRRAAEDVELADRRAAQVRHRGAATAPPPGCSSPPTGRALSSACVPLGQHDRVLAEPAPVGAGGDVGPEVDRARCRRAARRGRPGSPRRSSRRRLPGKTCAPNGSSTTYSSRCRFSGAGKGIGHGRGGRARRVGERAATRAPRRRSMPIRTRLRCRSSCAPRRTRGPRSSTGRTRRSGPRGTSARHGGSGGGYPMSSPTVARSRAKISSANSRYSR